MRKLSISRAVLTTLAAGLLLAALPSQTAAQGFQFHSLTPCRVFDTRVASGDTAGAPALATGSTRTFVIQGKCNVPVGAKAVSVNVTAVAPSWGGYLTLFPTGVTRPVVSTVNFNPGEKAIANGAIVPLGDQGPYPQDLSVYAFVNKAGGTVHAILDVAGYFE
jgi:hypothetical protein